MVVDDGGFGIRRERELTHLHLMASLFCLGFRQAHAADLRLTVGAAGNMVFVDWLCRFAGNTRGGNNPFHGACVSKLWKTRDNVANGIDALFASLHPLIGVDEAALHLDVRSF